MRFKDKSVIVTGAAQGIGRACAEAFAAEGARVVIADVAMDAAADVERAIADAGGTARVVQCDVGDKPQVEAMVAATVEAFGGVDILINNAGTIKTADFLELEEEDFDRVLRVNLKGMFLVAQAVARRMVEQGGGAIVNMSSVNAVMAIPNQVPYNVSKGGVNQLTRVTALALADKGVRVNAIGPGHHHDRTGQDGDGGRRRTPQDPLANADGAPGHARGSRPDRHVPGQRRCQLHHRPDHLLRRRPHGAELRRAGCRLNGSARPVHKGQSPRRGEGFVRAVRAGV